MAVSFKQIIAGDPPAGGDTGAEFAQKINENFMLVGSGAGLTSKETSFNEDGSIEETMDSGFRKETVFNEDGSITESVYDGVALVASKVTSFNEDGSISEVLV